MKQSPLTTRWGRADLVCAAPPSRIGSVLAFVLLEALVGAANLGFSLFTADPVRPLDTLAGLEILVDLKEVLDFQAVELRDASISVRHDAR